MANLKPLISVYRLAFAVLSISFLSSSISAANGECWYLQMPKKNAEYLIKQCSKEDQTKYDKALDSLSKFIENGTIKELEICVRAEGQNEQEISGKRHQRKEVKVEDYVHYVGGYYSSYQDLSRKDQFSAWGEFNLNKQMTATKQPIFQIKTAREISKKWCPTFVKYEGNKAYILLEREPQSIIKKPIIKNYLTITLSNPELEETTLIWLVPYEKFPDRCYLGYKDITDFTGKGPQLSHSLGLNVSIVNYIIENSKHCNIGIRHEVAKGLKGTTHNLDIKEKEMSDQNSEFEYTTYTKDRILKDGKQGSVEIKLIPVGKK